MTGERTRGLLLYAFAALLATAGAVWWVRAAPREHSTAPIEAWQASAERLLPDAEPQADGDTLALAAAMDHEVDANVDNGEYQVSVVCVGGTGSQVRVSLGIEGSDSGRGLQCAGDHDPDSFVVSVAGQLRMTVSVNEVGPVVFRYVLQPTG